MSSFFEGRKEGCAKISVVSSPLHGEGVNARENIETGSIIYAERPLCFLQSLPNTRDVLVCGECQRFIGSLSLQIAILTKQVSRHDLISIVSRDNRVSSQFCGDLILSSTVCSCTASCGEFYCSEICRNKHWTSRHKLLCTGHITDEDAELDPLYQFKIHACRTNEIFLLAADVCSRICLEVERNMNKESRDTYDQIVTKSLEPYAGFVRNKWWDAARVSAETSAKKTTDPEEFVTTLKQLVADSWSLMSKALKLEERGLEGILTEEYLSRFGWIIASSTSLQFPLHFLPVCFRLFICCDFGLNMLLCRIYFDRTIGMFEQNNIGVRLQNPIAKAIEGLTEGGSDIATAEYILSVAEKIVTALEGMVQQHI